MYSVVLHYLDFRGDNFDCEIVVVYMRLQIDTTKRTVNATPKMPAMNISCISPCI